MTSLDARCIQETGIVTNEHAARESEFWKRLQAARGDCSCPIRNTLGAFEEASNRRVGLVALEFFVRREVRVGVTEPDDKSDRHLVVLQVIQERSTVGF